MLVRFDFEPSERFGHANRTTTVHYAMSLIIVSVKAHWNMFQAVARTTRRLAWYSYTHSHGWTRYLRAPAAWSAIRHNPTVDGRRAYEHEQAGRDVPERARSAGLRLTSRQLVSKQQQQQLTGTASTSDRQLWSIFDARQRRSARQTNRL